MSIPFRHNNPGLANAKADFMNSLFSLPPERVKAMAEQPNTGKPWEGGKELLQYVYGFMLYAGEVMPQDYAEAFRWWTKAAAQGEANAQHALGICYRFGRGTLPDITKSAEMLRRAAENGHPQAQNDLGNCYMNGEGVVRDLDQATQWWMKAAMQDVPQAQFNVGCVAHDQEKNYTKAYAWWKLAGNRHPKAPLLLQQLGARLRRHDLNYAELCFDSMRRLIRGENS